MKIFKDLEDFKNQLKINNIGIIIGKHDYNFFKATFIVLFKVLSVERKRVEKIVFPGSKNHHRANIRQ